MAKRSDNNARKQTYAKQCSLCPSFGRCGGCSLLDIPYTEQLARKQTRIEELFAKQAPDGAIRLIKGMDEPFYYRDKVISPFAPGKRGPHGKQRILTGMYERGTHRLVSADECLLENQVGNAVVQAVRSIMGRHDIAPYDERTGRGFMRHVVVRIGHKSKEVLVTLVVNAEGFPASRAFCRELIRRVPEVTTVVQNINRARTNVILGQEERTLYGPGFILDELCGLSFRISSGSFYQVNSMQTEVLYDEAIRLSHADTAALVIDAYCGTGTIGLVAAKRGARQLVGVDSVSAAIHDARANAKHNGIEHAQFMVGDAAQVLPQAVVEFGGNEALKDAVLMMDPPRAGASSIFLETIAALGVGRVGYISCDPLTQARDVEQLRSHGFHIEVIQPVDMFPHTDHIENIVVLSR